MEVKNVRKAWDIFKLDECKGKICEQQRRTFNCCNFCSNLFPFDSNQGTRRGRIIRGNGCRFQG